ncbi:flagellar brake protein [Vogesella sp. LIG4]|uniref:flagellar brake protein n=1 Tax=Vogesella sp. LIG4 TaxID=1192162 RepID=UPI00081FFC2A|nr:flagellar brake protein [Vogesella sp. LIG4]SCK13967.1 c-di-GMP-binding flagellar brake protein YcgR, contains PilZNR and PilZ domains [Vogesella sp. LIG4]
MTEHTPPRANSPQQAELARFTISSPLEIQQHLRSLAELKQAVTVFSNKGNTFIVTRLWAVDADNDRLVFGLSADENANRHLLASERNVMVSSPAGIKMQFICGPAEEVEYEGRRAVAMAIPDKIIRLQRREFFRINTPPIKQVWCRLPAHPGRMLPLFDISLGGMSLTLAADQHDWLQAGEKLERVEVDLPEAGLLQVGLEVLHVIPVLGLAGHEHYRAGCAFADMNMARESLLQRYITHLERERRALVR